MRIAHISSFRPDTANGVHAAVAQLTPHLVRCGVDVEIWHFRRDRYEVQERRDPSGVIVYELPFPLRVSSRGSGYLRRVPRATAEWIEAAGARLTGFHVHSVFQPEAWAVRSRLQLPFCVSPHGGYVVFGERTWRQRAKVALWLAQERHIVETASFFHAVSEADAASIRLLRADARVAVVPNGVAITDGSNPRKQPASDAPWVFLGRLDVGRKGLDLLIRAYACAAGRVPLPRLCIYGPDFRGGRRRLRQLIEELNLGDRVSVGGPVFGSEREELISRASLFVLTSRQEGLPLAALEALASGTPILVTPSTNLGDLVTTARAGFVATTGSIEAIAASLEEAAATSRVGLHEAGERGRAAVARSFRWELAAEQMVGAYQEFF